MKSHPSGSPTPPADMLAERFQLGVVREPPRFAARGELGLVWHLATDRGRWALKQLVTEVEPTTGTDVEFQLAVLAAGVPIPRPVLDATGMAVVIGPDGTGYRVYEWVDFDASRSAEPASAGALLARVHGLGWPAGEVHPWFWDPVTPDRWPTLISAARDRGMPWCDLLAHHVDDLVAATAAADGRPPGRPVRCHLDFNPDNVLTDYEGRVWVIDWENSGGGDPMQELVQSVYEFAGDDPDGGAAFLDGYEAAGGAVAVGDIGAFSMAFAVQANLVAFYAQRALDGSDDDRARSAWRLDTILPRLLTVERATRILALCAARST